MLDYFKIYAFGLNKDKLINNRKFDFISHKKVRSNEIVGYYTKWRNLVIIVNPKKDYVIIKGSLHKFYHGNNYSQFTFNDYLKCLTLLNDKLGVDPSNSIIKRFEFGYNLLLQMNPIEIIERIIAYRRTRFAQMVKGKAGTLGVYCDFDRMKIKVYNKSKQYSLSEYILRLEIVIKKMDQITNIWNLKIETLADLADLNIWDSLSEKILSIYDAILFDEVIFDELKIAKNKELYLRYCTSDSFERAKRELHRNTFGYQIKRFEALQSKYGYGMKASLRKTILKMADILFEDGANAQDSIVNPKRLITAICCADVQLDSMVHLHKEKRYDKTRIIYGQNTIINVPAHGKSIAMYD